MPPSAVRSIPYAIVGLHGQVSPYPEHANVHTLHARMRERADVYVSYLGEDPDDGTETQSTCCQHPVTQYHMCPQARDGHLALDAESTVHMFNTAIKQCNQNHYLMQAYSVLDGGGNNNEEAVAESNKPANDKVNILIPRKKARTDDA